MRVRWEASADARVVGYEVFRRTVPGSFGAPEPGTPTSAPDGTLSLPVTGLEVRTDYAFAVKSVSVDGVESAFSNERRIGYAQVAPLLDSDGDGLTDAEEDRNLDRRVDPGETDPERADTDGDGVGDAADLCPDTAAGDAVDARGCACAQVRCGDGDPCNGFETCRAGRCEPGAPPACDDGNPCTADACDAALGRCVHQSAAACCTADADCADTDACTVNERCEAGRCVSDALACPEPGACAGRWCDPVRGCEAIPPDGTPCDDADPCTAGDACAEGPCGSGAAAAPLALAVHRFALGRAGRRGQRLVARASFPAVPGLDPTRTGLVLRVEAAGGAPLYEAAVPGSAFARRGRRRGARFVLARGGRAGIPGLRRLVLDAGALATDVRVRVAAPEVVPSATRGLRWLLRLGDWCVRGAALTCEPAGARVIRCR